MAAARRNGKHCGPLLQFASEALKNDKEFMMAARHMEAITIGQTYGGPEEKTKISDDPAVRASLKNLYDYIHNFLNTPFDGLDSLTSMSFPCTKKGLRYTGEEFGEVDINLQDIHLWLGEPPKAKQVLSQYIEKEAGLNGLQKQFNMLLEKDCLFAHLLEPFDPTTLLGMVNLVVMLQPEALCGYAGPVFATVNGSEPALVGTISEENRVQAEQTVEKIKRRKEGGVIIHQDLDKLVVAASHIDLDIHVESGDCVNITVRGNLGSGVGPFEFSYHGYGGNGAEDWTYSGNIQCDSAELAGYEGALFAEVTGPGSRASFGTYTNGKFEFNKAAQVAMVTTKKKKKAIEVEREKKACAAKFEPYFNQWSTDGFMSRKNFDDVQEGWEAGMEANRDASSNARDKSFWSAVLALEGSDRISWDEMLRKCDLV